MSGATPPPAAERGRWTLGEIGVVVTALLFVGFASLPWYVARLGPGERLPLRAWDLGLLALLSVLLSVYAAGRVVWLRYRPPVGEVPLAPGVEPFVASFVAMLLMLYRSLDVPPVPLAAFVERTVWLIVALFVVASQVVFAGQSVARTGFRA